MIWRRNTAGSSLGMSDMAAISSKPHRSLAALFESSDLASANLPTLGTPSSRLLALGRLKVRTLSYVKILFVETWEASLLNVRATYWIYHRYDWVIILHQYMYSEC